MQNLKRAAHSFSLLILISVAAAVAQTNRNSSNVNARGKAIPIDKVNTRPTSNLQQPIREYESLMAKSPSDPVILNNLGASYYMLGRYYEAQSLIRNAAARAPDSINIKINLAIVQNRLYNPALAIATLESVLAKHPGESRARSILCDLYGQEKRNQEAAPCYEIVSLSGKLDAMGAANFGTVLLDLDQLDRALDVLRFADAKFPNDPGVKNGLGVALFRKKKYAQAEEYLVRAVQLQPDGAQLRFNLAMAQVMTRNRGSVLEQYRYLKIADPELAGRLYKLMFRDKLVFVDNK